MFDCVSDHVPLHSERYRTSANNSSPRCTVSHHANESNEITKGDGPYFAFFILFGMNIHEKNGCHTLCLINLQVVEILAVMLYAVLLSTKSDHSSYFFHT